MSVVHLASHRAVTETDVDRAWAAYAAHRCLELRRPALVDDPDHVAKSERLHRAFFDLFAEFEGMGSNVIPFHRRAR